MSSGNKQLSDSNVNPRGHFAHAPSQWETTLHCNIVPHWLGAYTEWSLWPIYVCRLSKATMSWWLYVNILTWEHNQFASLSRDGWDHTKLFSFIWRKFIQQQVSIYSNVTCFTYDANYYDSISTFQNVYFHVSFCILECKRNMTNAVTLNCQTELCWITYRTPYMNHLIHIC